MDHRQIKNNPIITRNSVVLTLPLSTPAATDLIGAIATAYAAAVVLVPTMDPWDQVQARVSGIKISNSSLNKCYVRGAGIGLGAGLTTQGEVVGTDCQMYMPIQEISREGLAYECASTIAVRVYFDE